MRSPYDFLSGTSECSLLDANPRAKNRKERVTHHLYIKRWTTKVEGVPFSLWYVLHEPVHENVTITAAGERMIDPDQAWITSENMARKLSENGDRVNVYEEDGSLAGVGMNGVYNSVHVW